MSLKVKLSMILSIILIVCIVGENALKSGNKIYNSICDMNAVITSEVVSYGTDYVYDENIPSTAEPVVLEEGVNGLSLTYDGLNYTRLSDVKNQVLKVGTGKQGEYKGRLTGYGPDCEGCSKLGNVSCRTREGKVHSLKTDGIYYNDIVYGKLRILAADQSQFPCGTVIKINNGVLNEFYGIVLDTGYTMRKAWSEGTVWIDLAFESQKVARTGGATSSNTKFSVQRWGW